MSDLRAALCIHLTPMKYFLGPSGWYVSILARYRLRFSQGFRPTVAIMTFLLADVSRVQGGPAITGADPAS